METEGLRMKNKRIQPLRPTSDIGLNLPAESGNLDENAAMAIEPASELYQGFYHSRTASIRFLPHFSLNFCSYFC